MDNVGYESYELDDFDPLGGEDIDDLLLPDSEEFPEEPDDYLLGDAGEDFLFFEPESAERWGRVRRRQIQMARRAAYLRALRNRRRRERMRYAGRLGGRGGRSYPRPRPAPVPRRPRAPATQSQVQNVGSAVKQNRTAIKNVDLDNKVLTDAVSKSLNYERDRITRNQQSVLLNQLIDAVGSGLTEGEEIRRGLGLLPMLLMKPDKRKPEGFQGLIQEPWFWTVLGCAALLIIKSNPKFVQDIRDWLSGNASGTKKDTDTAQSIAQTLVVTLGSKPAAAWVEELQANATDAASKSRLETIASQIKSLDEADVGLSPMGVISGLSYVDKMMKSGAISPEGKKVAQKKKA